MHARCRLGFSAAIALVTTMLCLPSMAHAQLVTSVVDRDGVTVPCVTIGPLAPIAQEYCVRRTLAEGFVRKSELGATGLSIGVAGAEDGVITAVTLGSPAAQAGLQVGDRIRSVDGRPVQRTPVDVAEQLLFGPRNAPVQLTIRRGGATVERSFKRGSAPEPAGAPKSPNFLVGIHPMMNWRGEFIPCMGAGVLGPAAIAACLSHYRVDGFVHTSELGSTGVTFDQARTDAAIVGAVEPGSPAATELQPGDEVSAVDGKPLTASLGKSAEALLFGKVDATRHVVVERRGRQISADVVLVGSAKIRPAA